MGEAGNLADVSQQTHWWNSESFSALLCKDNSVKKWQLRFDIAKAAVLRRKTYAFTVQNNRFWNAKQ